MLKALYYLALSTLLTLSACALAESGATISSDRESLSVIISKDLLCQKMGMNDRAGDSEADGFLKKSGAIIALIDDPYYNQFRYSFVEALNVGQKRLYSVQQAVGEGGVIFIAEVAGDLPAFVREINAGSAKEDDDFLGVSNILFYKTLKENISPDSEPEFTKVVIGQNPIQKEQGRFFYCCIQTMNLG